MININDTVTAKVRTATFTGAYVYKEHEFVVKSIDKGWILGHTFDGSLAKFPVSHVLTINGMDLNRLEKSKSKDRKWDI